VLKHWVEDTKPQGIVLSDALIRCEDISRVLLTCSAKCPYPFSHASSKAKEEARRLGILEDKFKASSGWLENFKHRVGIRKGKYIGREPWPAASDSEGEDPPPTAKQLNEQRIIFMADPPSGYEHAMKGLWRMPVSEIQRQQASQNEQQAMLASTSEHASEPAESTQSHASGSGHPAESGSEQGPTQSEQHSPTSGPRPGSQLEGRRSVGMRKTRSRTLAEAREAQAALTGDPGSPPGPTSPATALVHTPALGPAADIAPALDPSPGHGPSHETLPRLSQVSPSTSHSPSAIVPPDGREASAGLDAALDFIGYQPQGFATPEEVAVLQKLSRRMSCAELPRHTLISSGPGGWNGTGET
jgi:hypothetical protein